MMKTLDEYTDDEIRKHNEKVLKSLGINIIFDEYIPVGELRLELSTVSKNHLGENLRDDLK